MIVGFRGARRSVSGVGLGLPNANMKAFVHSPPSPNGLEFEAYQHLANVHNLGLHTHRLGVQAP